MQQQEKNRVIIMSGLGAGRSVQETIEFHSSKGAWFQSKKEILKIYRFWGTAS
jgi:hypothetical protein